MWKIRDHFLKQEKIKLSGFITKEVCKKERQREDGPLLGYSLEALDGKR
jgi:nucleoside-triphosphatase THEP1